MEKQNVPSYGVSSVLPAHTSVYFPYHHNHHHHPLFVPPVLDNILCVNRSFPYYYDHHLPVASSSSLSPQSQCGSETSQEPNTSEKPARPFKMYSKDPVAMSLNISSDAILSKNSDQAYVEFREKMLHQSQNTAVNKNMKRSPQGHTNDPCYMERRKRNNEAAKRSRDARKAKEDEIAIRCAFLEKENLHLKIKIATLETERDRLHNMVYR